jgi:hypothetical protein
MRHSDKDIIVDWDGPEDRQNPRKYDLICSEQHGTDIIMTSWPYKRKWAATLVVSAFTFISAVASSMIAPASGQLASKLGITSSAVQGMTTSVFVLAYGECHVTCSGLRFIYYVRSYRPPDSGSTL